MKKMILVVMSLLVAVFLVGCSTGEAVRGEETLLKPPTEPVTPEYITLKTLLATLNQCTFEWAGDNDDLVDYNTFPDGGSGVCNTLCKNTGKTCIEAYAIFTDFTGGAVGEWDVTTIPRLCSSGKHSYRPSDEVTGYYPAVACRCC